MGIDLFYSKDIERDIKILLSHHRHHVALGQKEDDILNSVFVGSLIKGRLFLDMLGIKAKAGGLDFGKSKGRDINALKLNARFATSSDLLPGEEQMLADFLTSVNSAEAHRDGYQQNNDSIMHTSVETILRLVDVCLFQTTGRVINYHYAKKLLSH
jgi:hypothetical protein